MNVCEGATATFHYKYEHLMQFEKIIRNRILRWHKWIVSLTKQHVEDEEFDMAQGSIAMLAEINNLRFYDCVSSSFRSTQINEKSTQKASTDDLNKREHTVARKKQRKK